MIPCMTIDSTKCLTELCMLGQICGTDKTPYNLNGHRHPYTAIYSMLMGQYKHNPVRFVEIGVAGGASVLLWNKYFEKGTFYFYDRDQNFLDHSAQIVSSVNNTFMPMDVTISESIRSGFAASGGNLDIILDDSTHYATHQKLIIHEALPFLRSGGMIIIEDVTRAEPEENYFNYLKDILHEFSFVSFIMTEHANRYSPGWDNDKLLVLIKK